MCIYVYNMIIEEQHLKSTLFHCHRQRDTATQSNVTTSGNLIKGQTHEPPRQGSSSSSIIHIILRRLRTGTLIRQAQAAANEEIELSTAAALFARVLRGPTICLLLFLLLFFFFCCLLLLLFL